MEKTPIKIQLYPYLDKIHSAYNSLVSDPPKGYIFIGIAGSKKVALIEQFKKSRAIRFLYKNFVSLFKTTKITELANREEEIPEAKLIYSFNTYYQGKKPFIVDILDTPYALAGNSYDLLMKHKKEIEEYLSKENCKKIICPHESAFEFMKKNFGKTVSDKLVLIRQAIKPVKYSADKDKFRRGKKIKILFMGSITNPQDFYMKGGLECVQVFRKISEKYDAELIMRCIIPKEVKKFIGPAKNIKILEDRLPFEEIVKLYSSSDILLLPSYWFMLMATLESMYFGLPMVTVDSYAVKDFLKNNYNAFIVEHSKKYQFYKEPSYPAILRTKDCVSQIWDFDEDLINRLAEKVELLIKNPELRKKMGENGRKIIKAKFSIALRNKKLKKVFDEALKS